MSREFLENGSAKLQKLFATIFFLVLFGIGNVWAVDPPTLSDLSFGTPIIDEDFNSVSTVSRTTTVNPVGNLSGFGVFDKIYNNSASNTYAIEDETFSTNSLKLTQGSGSALVLGVSGKTYGTSGAFRFKTTTSAYCYIGICTSAPSSNAYTKADASVFIRNQVGELAISKNTSSNNWQSIGTFTSTTEIDICVIYNNTNTGTTYGNSISLGSCKAHVYVNGTCVNSNGTPTAFTLSGSTLSYFKVSAVPTNGYSAYIDDIKVYDALPTAAASCESDPSIGAASLDGTFNLSTVGVQCASITPGTDCSVASGDYGFIWYANDGTKKEIGGTGVTKVAVTSGAYRSGTFSANLSSTFVLGNRYSVRAFATNGKPATVYSDTITFQPRSVTFNLNGHGSSTPTTQYVNNGGKASDPSYSESVTGYTFGGWYKEAGCSNAWTFGTDVVSGANKTIYAKWTANEYTITLDQDLTPTTTGTTSITVTYDANTNLTSAITKPTMTGWTFAGYFTAKNGGGTQIIGADGNVIASVTGYTDASKNWIGTSDITLYAKWTCTVTWSVNGATDVYSAHTLTYNASSTKVASIPGPPSPASYCGDKFVGWTRVENYVHGTSDLFTTVAGSPELKTVGDVTFYAVFADYDE